ncbi:MAG: polysaccharide biosynthesis/export family protein [Myxococcales bacterium]|nr:polysaccharide biosynthesis/export family protein [Myxococcales bacterium]
MNEAMRVLAGRTETTLATTLLLALLAGVGCAGRAPSAPPPDPTPMAREPYLIGVTDVLLINVWKNPELSVEVPVRADGMISVPLIDDVQAEGLSPQELKEVITRELSEFVTAPDVTIIVSQMNSRFISVVGEVRQDMRIPLTRDMRVLEAIAHVGGFSTFADRGDVRIVRRQPDGSEVEYRFDYNAYIRGKAPGTNIVLHPGDMIIVPD